MKVTLNIPKEAAIRLKFLAEEGHKKLQELGILSVEIEGDRKISLKIAGKNNELTELIFNTSELQSSVPNSKPVHSAPGVSASRSTEDISKLVAARESSSSVAQEPLRNNFTNHLKTTEKTVLEPLSIQQKYPTPPPSVSAPSSPSLNPRHSKMPPVEPLPLPYNNHAVNELMAKLLSSKSDTSPLLVNLLSNEAIAAAAARAAVASGTINAQDMKYMSSRQAEGAANSAKKRKRRKPKEKEVQDAKKAALKTEKETEDAIHHILNQAVGGLNDRVPPITMDRSRPVTPQVAMNSKSPLTVCSPKTVQDLKPGQQQIINPSTGQLEIVDENSLRSNSPLSDSPQSRSDVLNQSRRTYSVGLSHLKQFQNDSVSSGMESFGLTSRKNVPPISYNNFHDKQNSIQSFGVGAALNQLGNVSLPLQNHAYVARTSVASGDKMFGDIAQSICAQPPSVQAERIANFLTASSLPQSSTNSQNCVGNVIASVASSLSAVRPGSNVQHPMLSNQAGLLERNLGTLAHRVGVSRFADSFLNSTQSTPSSVIAQNSTSFSFESSAKLNRSLGNTNTQPPGVPHSLSSTIQSLQQQAGTFQAYPGAPDVRLKPNNAATSDPSKLVVTASHLMKSFSQSITEPSQSSQLELSNHSCEESSKRGSASVDSGLGCEIKNNGESPCGSSGNDSPGLIPSEKNLHSKKLSDGKVMTVGYVLNEETPPKVALSNSMTAQVHRDKTELLKGLNSVESEKLLSIFMNSSEIVKGSDVSNSAKRLPFVVSRTGLSRSLNSSIPHDLESGGWRPFKNGSNHSAHALINALDLKLQHCQSDNNFNNKLSRKFNLPCPSFS